MGSSSTESNPDALIKREIRGNVTAYYNYILVYVDDFLHLEKDAQEVTLKLNQVYLLKEVLGATDIYIGENFDKVQLKDGRNFWSMTYVEYLCGAIKNVDLILEGNMADLKSFGNGHCPYP